MVAMRGDLASKIRFTPTFSSITKRVETVSGALYQFTKRTYADGSERTLMVRLPGFDGNVFGSLNEPVDVKRMTSERADDPCIGERMVIEYIDSWDGEVRTITSSPVARIHEWKS